MTKTVGLSGSYSIKRLLDGYYDQECYFNCPVSYMANLSDERLLGLVRRMEISLVTSDWDIGICRERTYDMSRVLSQRGISHKLDDWEGHTVHDWPRAKYDFEIIVRSLERLKRLPSPTQLEREGLRPGCLSGFGGMAQRARGFCL